MSRLFIEEERRSPGFCPASLLFLMTRSVSAGGAARGLVVVVTPASWHEWYATVRLNLAHVMPRYIPLFLFGEKYIKRKKWHSVKVHAAARESRESLLFRPQHKIQPQFVTKTAAS